MFKIKLSIVLCQFKSKYYLWIGQSVHEQHLNAHHFPQALEARGDGHSPECWCQ